LDFQLMLGRSAVAAVPLAMAIPAIVTVMRRRGIAGLRPDGIAAAFWRDRYGGHLLSGNE
jgi:hypothetical protein